MIDFSVLDLSKLPWMYLMDRASFPLHPSIYFAIDADDVVQYIGKASSPRNRWSNHEQLDTLLRMDLVKIAFLMIGSVELLPEIERALICYYSPQLNRQHTVPEKDPADEQIVYSSSVKWYTRDEVRDLVAKESGRSISVSRFYAWAKAIQVNKSGLYSEKDTARIVYFAQCLNTDRSYKRAAALVDLKFCSQRSR